MQHTAKGLAALGRNGDSMLMHVNPTEVAALSQLLGPTTTNPKTGLPEAYGWSNLIGSAIGGIGSFGIGESLAPIIGDVVGEGLMGDILKKAVPALAGAGFGAAVGGATGGKAGAMGGALQGGMSGGLGAYAAEDVFPQMGAAPEMEQQLNQDAIKNTSDSLYKPSTAQPSLYKPEVLGQYEPKVSEMPVSASTDFKPDIGTSYSLQGAGGTGTGEKPGFFDNLGTAAQTAFTKEGFKKYEDYVPYLFQAGMIGNAITSEQESKDSAQQAEEDMRRRIFLTDLQATNLARQTYGYAGGGPVVIQGNDIVPVQVRIPEHLVDKVKSAGGMPAFSQGLGSYANGGYINTQPFEPQHFYPQSQIPSARPYAGAAPTSVIDTLHEGASFAEGGLIDGEGDGMSDDIPAHIEGKEEVRVADGEYIIPRHIVDMIGVDRLDDLLRKVRRASYGTDEQVQEGAGLEAARAELGV